MLGAEPAGPDPILGHQGPWSEKEYLALGETEGNRVELLDGELLVSPVGSGWHQRIGSRLYRELDRTLPHSLEVLHEANVRLCRGRLVIPDIVVTRDLTEPKVYEAGAVELVAEVVSPWSASQDRILKPGLYAEAGIDWYVRVDREPQLALSLWHRRADDGSDPWYEEAGNAGPGGWLELAAFDCSIEVDALSRRRG